jgi:hypothetical protein
MKFKNLGSVLLCFVLAGCSTAAGVSKGNIFNSEGNPKVTIQVDPTLISQEPFSYEVLAGGSARTTKNTIYPFAELVGQDVKRALLIGFRDMTNLSDKWIDTPGNRSRNLSGVDFVVLWTGNFVDPNIAIEATKRNVTMKGQYTAVQFVKIAHQNRIMVLAYLEKTPNEFLNMYWDRDRLSAKQKEYLEQLESRATQAFTVIGYSNF